MPSYHFFHNEVARSILSPLTGGRAALNIRPTIATVYLTKFCNSRCTMCDFWKNEHDPKELTSEQWGVVFSRLKAFGVDFVGVNASGEMFTRKDVFEILGHLKSLGLGFGVNSNGTLFTPNKAAKLAALEPRAVTIGLDGVGDPAYLATRGLKRGFTKISTHLDNLQQAGISNIGIGTVLMPSSIDQWVPLAELALEKGLSGVRYTAYHEAYFSAPGEVHFPAAGCNTTMLGRIEAEIGKLIELKRATGIVKNSETYLRHVVDYYRDPSDYFPVPCLQGSSRIEIDIYGNVNLCSFVIDPLGNLLSQEMEEIWQSEQHRRARQDAFQGNCPKCFLSCYAEENLRLSPGGVLPTLGNSVQRARQLFSK
jgi:MoaA/NifB/PqqE/SkfB family radical SAM enzyme